MMPTEPDAVAALKQHAARHAADLVQDGMCVGLGTGSTATVFLHALADRVRQGLRIQGVPTSEATARLAATLGIPIVSLDDQSRLDMTIDGADEVDGQLNLVKGRGGALLREKIVASATRQLVIMVDPSKLVSHLGSHAAIPVEVIPFGWTHTRDALQDLGATVERRPAGEVPYLTDGGHYIFDCHFGPIAAPFELAAQIKALTGVVDHGLFLGMASTVIVGHPDHVEQLTR